MKNTISILNNHRKLTFFIISAIVIIAEIIVLNVISLAQYQLIISIILSFYLIKALYIYFVEVNYD